MEATGFATSPFQLPLLQRQTNQLPKTDLHTTKWRVSKRWKATTYQPQQPQHQQSPFMNERKAPPKRKPTDWATRSNSRSQSSTSSFQKNTNQVITEDQLISRIAGCSRRRNWYSAHIAFTHYIHNIEAPTPKVIGAYIHALSVGGRLQTAREVLNAYSPEADTPVARASLVSAIAKQNGPDEALKELQSMPSRLWSAHACTAVMHTLGVEGRSTDAIMLMKTARDRCGVKVDIEMYDAAMRALGREGKLNEAFQLLNEMKRERIKPSDVTLEALMYACAHVQTAPSGVESLGKRACIIYDAAHDNELLTPRVMSAFASAILRSGIWADDRVDDLIARMNSTLCNVDERRLKRIGVNIGLFQAKLTRLTQLVMRSRMKQQEAVRVQRLDLKKLNSNRPW